MKTVAQVILTAIKSSKGEMDGRSTDKTTFYLNVEMAESSWGESWGNVSSAFVLGDSSEQKKWTAYREHLKAGKGVPCEAELDIVAGGDGKPKLTLLGLRPLSTKAPAAA